MDRSGKELRHDRHTVSLPTDHLVITPKYRGKILTGEVGFVTLMNPIISLHFRRFHQTEAIIRGTCTEMSIKIIDMAVNTDHVPGRILRQEFPHLRDWCEGHLWAPGCYYGSAGQGWEVVEKYISSQNCAAGEEGL